MMDATFVEAPKSGANPDVDAVARIVVTTRDRLAASVRRRHEVACDLLFEGNYEHRLTLGTSLCLATFAAVLVRMFWRYGFRQYAPPIRDPVVATLHKTLLLLDDLEHLSNINFVDSGEHRSTVGSSAACAQ